MELDHFGKFHVFILNIDKLPFTVLVDCEPHELFYAESQGERLVADVDFAAWSAFSGGGLRHYWEFSVDSALVLRGVHKLLHFLIVIFFLHVNITIDKTFILDSETYVADLDVHVVEDLDQQAVQVAALIVFHLHLQRFL